MSTPQNSSKPVVRTGSSPLLASGKTSSVQLSEEVSGWIEGLSPSGASVYDTGWVNVPLRAGFTNTVTLQVRRIGVTAFLRGRVTGSYTTGNVIVADVAAGFRPSSQPPRPAVTFDNNATVVGSAVIGLDGSINVSAQTAGTRAANLYASWLVD